MKKILLAAFLLAVAVPCAYALNYSQNSPESIRADAFNDVKLAQEFMDQAAQMLQGSTNRQKIELAINLYIKAGQLFEKVGRIFNALGPDYVSREDVDGAKTAMEGCLTAIQKLKERLQKM